PDLEQGDGGPRHGADGRRERRIAHRKARTGGGGQGDGRGRQRGVGDRREGDRLRPLAYRQADRGRGRGPAGVAGRVGEAVDAGVVGRGRVGDDVAGDAGRPVRRGGREGDAAVSAGDR